MPYVSFAMSASITEKSFNVFSYNKEPRSSVLNSSDVEKFNRLMLATESSEENAQLAAGVHDGHLNLEEASYHWQHGNGEPVTVDASRLTVHQVGEFNADNWAKGIVQGSDFFVHGRVSLFKDTDNQTKIKSEKFDFDERQDGSSIRNWETRAGKWYVGEGTPYTIHYEGSPNVIKDGWTYGQ